MHEDAEVKVELAEMAQQIRYLTDSVKGLTTEVAELKRPRPTNWIAIGGFCLMAVSPMATIGGFYVSSQVDPIKQQFTFDKREREWLFDSIEKHFEHFEKIQDWHHQKIYGDAAPPFVPPTKK